MNTILLAWNPYKWDWNNLQEEINQLAKEGSLIESWSCGTRKNIPSGSRFFLIRLGKKPKGIIGSGYTTHIPQQNKHFNNPKKLTWYINIRFDMLSEQPIISREFLNLPPFNEFHWDTQMSGINVPPSLALLVEEEWTNQLQKIGTYIDTIVTEDLIAITEEENSSYEEGGQKQKFVNYFERNREIRIKAIKIHGITCKACGFDFLKFYGERGRDYIEVHHKKLISNLKEKTQIDPENDMDVLCSNCHRMIHRKKDEILSIEELKKIIKINKKT